MSEEIRGLETAIANLGGQADLRAPLQARIESLKLSVVRSKPLCVQLEECRKLVQRRQARRDQAHESVRQATLTLEKADSELQAAHFELKALQEEFAHRESPQQRESPANSMQALTAALTQVISDMRGGGVIPDQLIQQTEQHMKQLMNGVTAIATAVAEQTGNAAAAPTAVAASEAYKRVGPSEGRTSHRWLIGDVYGRPQVESLWLSRQIHQHARRQMRCTWKLFDRLRPTINRADNGPRHMATMATSQTPERNEV